MSCIPHRRTAPREEGAVVGVGGCFYQSHLAEMWLDIMVIENHSAGEILGWVLWIS